MTNSHLRECGREKAFWFNSPSLARTSGGIENRTGGLFYYAHQQPLLSVKTAHLEQEKFFFPSGAFFFSFFLLPTSFSFFSFLNVGYSKRGNDK